MRSLTVKLSLAFFLVGIIGAVLVAFLVGMRTRFEFDRFLSEHDQEILLRALEDYYATHGSWADVRDIMPPNSRLDFYSRQVALIDSQHNVILGQRNLAPGQKVSDAALVDSVPIKVDNQTVGFLLVNSVDNNRGGPPDQRRAENAFLDEVNWAVTVSAGLAALIALILGIALARTLTRPLRELTAATKAMASGQLDQQVTVRSRDEIGALAASFNQMSADLVKASQLRQQMTADLAHDLRTPLTILRGYTEGLKDGRLQPTPAMCNLMFDEVEHLQRLVEDLRLLSLADAGELSLNRRAVDPAALIERTGLAYMVQAQEHGLTLKVEAAENLPSIMVDTDRITQVLNNLVSNALRHTSAGEIVLSAIAGNRTVQLKVQDTGSGIPPKDIPFVFDRFYRADKSRQRTTDNASGLGLAIAKAFVEAHDGVISVESKSGHGTTFTVTFPALES
ncbi:MAG: HAMP domain-containing protein [Anaerolineae bacterium]|nr:HAMP domain-containing protein [Anaerolineae bacterium]